MSGDRVLKDKEWGMKPDVDKALMLAQRALAVLVCDAVNLEGIAMTLPEVQTLLDGITVGGHKVSDQHITLNQGKAWAFIFTSLKEKRFSLSVDYVLKLHSIAAHEEALTWGVFRTGGVNIAGTDYSPPNPEALPRLFDDMCRQSLLIDDVYDRAISVFLDMAKNQFFYDVNKRMGRFIMNGMLLEKGYPAINLPAKRQLEFNELMLDYYNGADQKPMNAFMRSCLSHQSIKIMRESHHTPSLFE